MAINQCGLVAAESNRAVLRYIPEDNDCWGVTPASGKTREMRITSSSLAAEKETVVSNELRADRMVSDVIETAASSGGDIEVEFSAGSLDDFLQAFLLGLWTRPMSFDKFEGSNLSIVDNAGTTEIHLAGGDFRQYFVVGRTIKTEGFIKPENNDYWTVDSTSFALGTTVLVTDSSTGVAEVGRSYSKVFDANDAIVVKNADVRAGTSGANTFDSDGNDAFASLITARQLVVGQKIYVTGLGYEEGTITVTAAKESGTITFAAVAIADDEIEVDDGTNPAVSFTFAAVAAGLNVVAVGADAGESAANLAAAITAHPNVNVTATDSLGVVTLVNDFFTGGSITEVVDDGGSITVVDFSGGADPIADGESVVINDGVRSVIFEFDSDSAFSRGAVGVSLGTTPAETAENLQVAIMDQLWKNKVSVAASVSGAVVTVRNLHADQVTNQATSAIVTNSTGVSVSDFSGATDTHGVYTITALTDDVITVAEEVATNANASGRPVTIKGSHLRNPGDLEDITPQSFSIETGFTDVGQYFKQTGLRVGAFSLSVATGEIVAGTLTFQGKETSISQVSQLGNAPYEVLASTATPIFNATTNVGSIYKNGELLATALQSIEINGEATLREQRAVGSRFPAGIGTGRFNLTGTFTSYFETLEMYDHFLNHDTISLAFPFQDNENNVYWFTIPALKITSDPVAPGGIDQDVLEELEYTAIRDPNLSTMFMVDRFSSVLPATS